MTYRHSKLRAKLAKPITWWRKVYATVRFHVEHPITTREFKLFLAVPVGLVVALQAYDIYLIRSIAKQAEANLAASERLVEETRQLNRSIDELGESFDDMPRLELDGGTP